MTRSTFWIMMILIGPVGFPIILCLLFSFYPNRKRRLALKNLSNFLIGHVSKFLFLPTFNGEYLGLKFSISLIPVRKNLPDFLQLSFIKKSFFQLNIYPESTLTNYMKKINLFGMTPFRELKINDESFDQDFFISSNYPDQVIGYLNNTDKKNAVRELFSNGFSVLSIDGKKISIRKSIYNLVTDLEPQRIMEALQKLSLLASGL